MEALVKVNTYREDPKTIFLVARHRYSTGIITTQFRMDIID